MERMLVERGVSTDFVWVDGETRLNIILVSTDGGGQSTFTSSSLIVPAGEQDQLLRRYQAALQQATCVILGGTLPEGVPLDLYPQMVSLAREQGIPVILDSSGPALRAGIEARPSLVKLNLDELSQLFGFTPQTLGEIYRAARHLQREFGTDVILTMGGQEALALLKDRAYQIPPLPVPISSTAGAGDAVLAGMALAVSRQEPLENGLKYGFALAAAVLQTLATADFRVEDYQALLPQIDLIPYPENDPREPSHRL